MNSHMNNPKVVGIIMTYECASLVEATFRRLPAGVFDKVIIVDDGSKDEIASVVARLGVPFFTHEHLGYGGNIKYGFVKALEIGADIMVEIHGDGQFGVEAIIPGIQKMQQGYDFIMGSRFTDWREPLRDKMSLARYLANIGLSFMDRLILRAPLTEYHGGLRFYSRRLVTTVNFLHTADDYLFSFEIIVQAVFWRLKIGEVPVRADYSRKHTSISIRKATVYAVQTFWILLLYVLARSGFKIGLFQRR